MDRLEQLRLAEAFFAGGPGLWETVRPLLLGALDRWPSAEIVTQKSQVGLRDPRPFCALSTHIRFPRQRVPEPRYVTLSLFLSRPLPDLRGGAAAEPYPGRFTNHIPLFSPADLDGALWAWLEEARQFRNPNYS